MIKGESKSIYTVSEISKKITGPDFLIGPVLFLTGTGGFVFVLRMKTLLYYIIIIYM